MKFVRESNEVAVTTISQRMISLLTEGKKVLWLTSGGSMIPLQVAMLDHIKDSVPQLLDHLLIMPGDERYGPPAHANSNHYQLVEAGFEPRSAVWIDILSPELDPEHTRDRYQADLTECIDVSDIVIATFGIGTDGHTAGVLPGSPAVVDTELATYYEADDFQRITLSLDAIEQHVDEAYVVARGQSKTAALERLMAHTEAADTLPSVVYTKIPVCVIFNDSIEKEVL